jgi:hypothetical protein
MSSPGTPLTPRGPVQGEILIDPTTGLPLGTADGNLNVNATFSGTIGTVTIDAETSSVKVEDPNTGFFIEPQADGSINVNTSIQASQNDSVLVYGTENGTPTGTQQVLKINADGSINVVDSGSSSLTAFSVFNSISSVPNGTLTPILNFTASTTNFLSKVEVSGTNMAQFEVWINGALRARQRTSLTEFNAKFDFAIAEQTALILNSGDNVIVQVIQDRPNLGDYEARMIYGQ